MALRSTPTRTTDTGTTTTSAAVTIAAHHTRHSDSTPPSSPCQPLPVVKRVRVLFSAVCTRVCLCARCSRPAYVWMMRTMVRAIHGVCMHTSRPRCSLTHLVMPCSVCARSSVRWDVIIRMGKSVKYVAPFLPALTRLPRSIALARPLGVAHTVQRAVQVRLAQRSTGGALRSAGRFLLQRLRTVKGRTAQEQRRSQPPHD